MNTLTAANAIANGIVAIAVVDMAIRVFGNRDHRIHSHPELFYIRKFVSSVVICGAVLNILTLSTPSWTEVVLNYGFAANYLFSCYYDRFTSSSNTKVSGKILKQCASCGPSSAGATQKGARPGGNGRKRIATR
jgi:hypothetical protein